MRYYLDCEFDGFGGPLLSLALVKGIDRGPLESLYWVSAAADLATDPWVRENVLPKLDDVPFPVERSSPQDLSVYLATMFGWDRDAHIITDWPDDLRYLMAAMITGPGQMIRTEARLRFTIARVDAYPTRLEKAVQHNAWWDAQALRDLLEPGVGL